MVLWCNLHAGFIYGLGVLFSFAVGARWAKRESHVIAALDRSFLVCLVATLLNPSGVHLYRIFFQMANDFRKYATFLDEWTRPTFGAAPAFWASLGLLSLDHLRCSTKNATDVYWIPAVVLFALYGMGALRSTVWLAFVATPLLALVLKGASARVKTMLWVFCAVALMIDWELIAKPLPKGRVDWGLYPTGACRFVKDQKIHGRMYNPLAYGGYIDWALGPEEKCFVDGRYIFYPIYVDEQRILDSEENVFKESAWDAFFRRYAMRICHRPLWL